MRRKIIIPLTIVLLIVLDQLVKWAVVSNIKLGEVKGFIPSIMSLTYLQNTGAAFSILENQQWLFTIITLLVIGGAIWYLIKNIKKRKGSEIMAVIAALSLIHISEPTRPY